MTVDEELTGLESLLRRLKIEYEIFFSNPQKKPPSDLEWKVLGLLRKFSDGGGNMNFPQRFRYNAIAQRYAIYSDLWRKKVADSRGRLSASAGRAAWRCPESGRMKSTSPSGHKVYGLSQRDHGEPFVVDRADSGAERDKVEKLFIASERCQEEGRRKRLRVAGKF